VRFQLDGKNRAGADDDDENGVQLQGRRGFVFTDPENYETVKIAAELVGDAKNYSRGKRAGDGCVRRGEGRVRRNSASVILTVADAPEGVRGGFRQQRAKAVTLETGIRCKRPLFIKNG